MAAPRAASLGQPEGQAGLLDDSGHIARLFEDRSGRIITFTRLVLAAVFYLALLVDPSQPVRYSLAGYLILFFYFLFAVAMASVAWRSWWWDFRLAWPAHVVDIFAFLASVYFTESVSDDFTSPFLAFFAYLMLSATIRWDWRLTAATGLLAASLYLLVGLAMEIANIELDIYRFGRRVVYMLVLAIILTWLGHQRRGQKVGRFTESPGAAEDRLPPMMDALRYAMAETGAGRGAIAWADSEEPQIEIRSLGLPVNSPTIVPPGMTEDSAFPPFTQLFDCEKHRRLRPRHQGGVVSEIGPVKERLAQICGVNEGLSVPFDAVTGRGEVLLVDIAGPSADHVVKAGELAREIGSAFDRHSTLFLGRESAVSLMRDTVARDLHDTIAQSLAGAALRLEGLRTWIANGGEPDEEIQSIKAALKAEQVQVRSMINRLRKGEDLTPETAAAQCLGPLLVDLASYWSVSAGLAPGSGRVAVPGSLIHDLRQLVREAVANAVRHGNASVVTIALDKGEDGLRVTISDNGSGFASDHGHPPPRTISERIEQLGGRLDIVSTSSGATLQFHLPQGAIR